MITLTDKNLGVREHNKSEVTIMMENNDSEGEQKLHRCFKKGFGPFTNQLLF